MKKSVKTEFLYLKVYKKKKNAQLFYIQPNNITIDVSMHSCIIYFLSKIKFELKDILKKNPLSDNIFSRFFENIVYTS